MSAPESLRAESLAPAGGSFAVRKLKLELLICLLLTFGTLAVYWQVKDFEFVRLDDNQYVTTNPYVQAGVTREGIAWAFRSGYASNWHPLTWLSHMLDCQLFGRDAGKHHLTNVAFHLANTVLVFLVLRQLTRALWRSAFVAALFALHPLHVESVAWIAERKDVLSTFFGLLTFWAYTRYAQTSEVRSQKSEVSVPTSALRPPNLNLNLTPNHNLTPAPRPLTSGFYWLAIFCFALGLMSKPMLVTLPFILLLLDHWPLQRFTLHASRFTLWSLVAEKIPFFVLTAASCVITYLAQKSGGSINPVSLPLRLGNAVLSYLGYLTKTFWPDQLAVFYPYRVTLETPPVIAAVVVLLLVTAAAVLLRRRQPWCAFGWFWFLGTLVPVIGLVQVGGQAMADRYSYLPLIGLFVALVWTVAALAGTNRARQLIAGVFGLVVVAACGWSAHRQTALWRDSVTLFTHALEVTPSAVAHDSLGTIFFDRREFTKARPHFEAALQLVPGNPISHSNLGIILCVEGKLDEAAAHFNAALARSPNDAGAHNNLGAVLLRQGKTDDAQAHFAAAVRADPFHADAHVNLGGILARQKKSAEAIAHFEAALRCRPGFADAHYQLGTELFAVGKLDAATTHFRAALASNPNHAEAHYQLATVLSLGGAAKTAREHYRAAVRLKPDWVEALNNLAWLLATHPTAELRDGPEAVRLAVHAVELTDHKDSEALDTLAAAYAEAGRFPEAVNAARLALGLAASLTGQQSTPDIRARMELYQQGRAYREPANP